MIDVKFVKGDQFGVHVKLDAKNAHKFTIKAAKELVSKLNKAIDEADKERIKETR